MQKKIFRRNRCLPKQYRTQILRFKAAIYEIFALAEMVKNEAETKRFLRTYHNKTQKKGKRTNMKKLISAVLSVSLILSSITVFGAKTEDELQKTADYVYINTQNPVAGSTGGEWAVFGLARSEYNVDSDYFLKYAENLQVGADSTPEYIVNPRFILALTSIGMDASNFKGKNLYSAILDTEKVTSFGVNAAAWALIALDCENYKTNGEEDKYISFILNSVLPNGGFSYSGKGSAEADVTAVVLQALAPYTDRADVKAAVEKAVVCLSEMQEDDGGFVSWGEKSAEGTIQVIIALNALDIPLSDTRFVKSQDLYENLMTFSSGDGGFKHLTTDEKSNVMTTEQALYSLASLERFESGKDKLYDMSAVVKIDTPRFRDIADSPYKSAIEILAEKGVINGVSDTEFNPYGDVTRAEYAAIVVRALGIKNSGENKFTDVNENDWFYESVCAAYNAGIINGISDTEFNPYGNITREESAAMTARAARYVGVDAATTENDIALAEKEYSDFDTVSDWAKDSAAFCFASGITSFEKEMCRPQLKRTREETAQMIYTVLSI